MLVIFLEKILPPVSGCSIESKIMLTSPSAVA